MKAYNKDIWRTIKRGKKRFFSIMLITMLGVTMLTGISASCTDLRYSADRFFDEQQLFDLRILSTLGLTEDDVESLKEIEGIEKVEGAYSEIVYTMVEGKKKSAEIKTISKENLNLPYLLEGSLPKAANEIAVTKNYCTTTGKTIGDIVEIEEKEDKEETIFEETSYVITGIVVDVMDVNSNEGAVAFRSTATTDYTFFVLNEAVNSDVHTAIYATLTGLSGRNSYSKEYEEKVSKVIEQIESQLKGEREQARYDAITGEAYEELSKAEKEANDELGKAEKKITDAEADIKSGKETLVEAKKELEKKEKQAKDKFSKAKKEIASGRETLEAALEQMGGTNAELEEELTQLTMKEDELKKQEDRALRQIKNGKKEIEKNEKELVDGEQELNENKKEFEEKKAEVLQELANARGEIEDIEMPQWYVQDRSSLSGYENIKTDASCIEAIGTVFPIIFFIVAILISLTTMNRKVEEDRGLIGTYQALGFTDREILKKYVLYAFAACLLGGILGNLFGFIVLPSIIFVIFKTMYQLPTYFLQFNMFYGIVGVALFVVGILIATFITCKAELTHMPATLIRPKAPRSGSRVFLEYITPIWKRLSFLNKVTARNLFRYKKRLLMTIAGIMGCTALLLCGFVIKDSVTDLMPQQYEKIYRYDLMAVTSAKENETLLSYMKDEEVADYLNVQIDSITLQNEKGKELIVQLIVVPTGETIDKYILTENIQGQKVELKDDGIFVTQNAGEVLDFSEKDKVLLQNTKLEQAEVMVSGMVKNYLGNNIYMTQALYEKLFGTFEANGALVLLSESCNDPAVYAEELGEKEGILSSISTEKLKEEFSSAFALVNMVVYIIIIMAAGLAFTVLFTLSTTNISERERELATIKVLGFYDKEVHLYVNKETLLLTAIGILLGLPAGYGLGTCLTQVLKMPSIYFAVSLHPISYVIAMVLAFVFALIVNIITNRSLDGIDPVEALKSVE